MPWRSSSSAPSSRAAAAAVASPSPAATMQPFIRMCHWRANGVRILDPGLLRKPGEEAADLRQVVHAGLAHRVAGLGQLEHHVDERAALEALDREPLAERVEDRQQPAAGRGRAPLDLGLQPGARPELLAPLEERQDQLVLGGEVAVERHLRDAGLGDDPVDADGTRAVPAEQLIGGREDAFAAASRFCGGASMCPSLASGLIVGALARRDRSTQPVARVTERPSNDSREAL